MWISITAGGFECNLNQFLSRCSYAAAVLRCLSVCLSVKRVHCDKTKATSASIVISYESEGAQYSFTTRENVPSI